MNGVGVCCPQLLSCQLQKPVVILMPLQTSLMLSCWSFHSSILKCFSQLSLNFNSRSPSMVLRSFLLPALKALFFAFRMVLMSFVNHGLYLNNNGRSLLGQCTALHTKIGVISLKILMSSSWGLQSACQFYKPSPHCPLGCKFTYFSPEANCRGWDTPTYSSGICEENCCV